MCCLWTNASQWNLNDVCYTELNMEPFLSRVEVVRDKFHLRWKLYNNPHAFFIAVGQTCDLSDTSRIFVVPGHIRSCDLDLGQGQWYGRVGSMIGDMNHGTIVWSGVYGPHSIQIEKSIVSTIPSNIEISKISPIYNGIRFYTSSSSPSYSIFETWTTYPISAKWTYYKDVGHGYADCGGIAYPTEYSIRVRNLREIPNDTIVQLAEAHMVTEQTSAKPTPVLDSTDHAVSAANNALLREASFQRNLRFASHADYVRYQSALAKVSGGKG
jgi:hypothetical protein